MGLVRNIILCLAVAMLSGAALYAQTDRREVRRGNRDFRKENFSEAEIDYRRALVKDSTSFAASYNLGNTLYRNGDMEQARKSYETLKDAAAVSRTGRIIITISGMRLPLWKTGRLRSMHTRSLCSGIPAIWMRRRTMSMPEGS